MAADPSRFEILATADAGYLRALVHGEYSVAASRHLVGYLVPEAERQGFTKLFVDIAAVTSGRALPSVGDQYETGKVIARDVRLKVAVVASAVHIEIRDFVDTVAWNRGALIKTFLAEPGALKWLLADQARRFVATAAAFRGAAPHGSSARKRQDRTGFPGRIMSALNRGVWIGASLRDRARPHLQALHALPCHAYRSTCPLASAWNFQVQV